MTYPDLENFLKLHYEFVKPKQRPEYYSRLHELKDFARLSRTEIAYRAQVWREYYDKVQIESPASQLFTEWKLWTQGKSMYTKEDLKEMTEDMKKRGLSEIEGRPKFSDPIITGHEYMQAEQTAQWIAKKEEKASKKNVWKE